MAHRHLLSPLLLGAFAALACSGGPGTSRDTEVGTQQPPFNSQQPSTASESATGDQSPTLNEQAPPLNEQAPPLNEQGLATSSTGSVSNPEAMCLEFCSRFEALHCTQGGECSSSCSTIEAELREDFGECADEFLSYLGCLSRSPTFSCESLDSDDLDPSCAAEASAIFACEELFEERDLPNDCVRSPSGEVVCGDNCTDTRCL
jgi:hypothetical protein